VTPGERQLQLLKHIVAIIELAINQHHNDVTETKTGRKKTIRK